MAKRKRLTPPTPEEVASGATGSKKGLAPGAVTGVGPALSPGPAQRAPIADMAGAAAASAALEEVAAELEAARSEGRLVRALPVGIVDAGHLMRDRITHAVDEGEMQSLIDSLKARGQQTPIEVAETAPGQYGLISGWRRLVALRYLYQETGDPRFANVQALVRHPESAAEAYVAMVEENEIRAGLSYFERAQIVTKTVGERVYDTEKEALKGLFGSASRAKRSKIKSFIPVTRILGPHLEFPTAIGERLGLRLSARLEAEDGFAERLIAELEEVAPQTEAAELALLDRAVAARETREAGRKETARPRGEEIAPDLWLSRDAKGLRLSGKGLTDAVEARLRAVLGA
ncbi:nuclease [Roseovarius spongiae]|uniref:Nuclease n=1 Tax=Roseovarius spongiae TaxID=2320272 RepID=A0A3A8B1K1_9RHOB|nr:ParB N-terminal domain-containing protein [Roseovarius spongiae]RKF12410.1 nuclease [Roseovarius spongiae]